MTGPVCQQIKAEVSSLCDAPPGRYLIMYEIDIRAFGGSLSTFQSLHLPISLPLTLPPINVLHAFSLFLSFLLSCFLFLFISVHTRYGYTLTSGFLLFPTRMENKQVRSFAATKLSVF